MSEVVDKIKSLERQNYLRAHQDEYPFPLDGTEWARLIGEKFYFERHPHCACDSCDNFLTRLHGNESPLRRQRKAVSKAMHHWFLVDPNADAYKAIHDQLVAHELERLQLDSTDAQPTATPSLADAERDWFSQQLYSRAALSGSNDASCEANSAGQITEGAEAIVQTSAAETAGLSTPDSDFSDLGSQSLAALIQELRDDLKSTQANS